MENGNKHNADEIRELRRVAERWRAVAEQNLPPNVFALYAQSINGNYKLPTFVQLCITPQLQGVACSNCNDQFSVLKLGEWRWSGERWEHKCSNAIAQAGHFVGTTLHERIAHVVLMLDKYAQEDDRETMRRELDRLAEMLKPYLNDRT